LLALRGGGGAGGGGGDKTGLLPLGSGRGGGGGGGGDKTGLLPLGSGGGHTGWVDGKLLLGSSCSDSVSGPVCPVVNSDESERLEDIP
jgi:hypothetical protein